jgi:hypothetical protein
MGVIDEEHQRLTLCEVRAQPEQAVKHRRRLRRLAARGVSGQHDRRGQSRGARQQRAALCAARVHEHLLEQRPHDPEPELPLKLAPTRVKRRDPDRGPGSCARLDQARLARAGRPLHL